MPVTDLRPGHRGFGRDFIEQQLPVEIGAITAMTFRRGGLFCSIEFDPAGPSIAQEGYAA